MSKSLISLANLPLFPLDMVVFPEQKIELHIFEPRYKQLIHECEENDIRFGIVSAYEDKVAIYGTEVCLHRIHERLPDGRLKIEVAGLRVFKLLQFYKVYPGRLYPGGKIHVYSSDEEEGTPSQRDRLRAFYERMAELLNLTHPVLDFTQEHLSFVIASQVGFSRKQKLKLLSLETESARQQMILDYFSQVLPLLENMMENL